MVQNAFGDWVAFLGAQRGQEPIGGHRSARYHKNIDAGNRPPELPAVDEDQSAVRIFGVQGEVERKGDVGVFGQVEIEGRAIRCHAGR